MPSIVSLPWYDAPATAAALDVFWGRLRCELADAGCVDLPSQLERGMALDAQWGHRELLLSQCCGLDLFARPAGELITIARPVFTALDGVPGSYFSYIVRRNGGGTGRVAVNARSSRSGCTALLEWMVAEDRPKPELIVSGSHHGSLEVLRAGHVDFAAIDAHAWSLLATDDIEVVARSTSALAPPYVMHRANQHLAGRVFGALERTVAELGHTIGVSAVLATQKDDYRSMALQASALGLELD